MLSIIMLSGCTEEMDKTDESGMSKLLVELGGVVTSSVVEQIQLELEYEYPVSDEFRESQIDKLVSIQVEDYISSGKGIKI